jgi:hypothetical protein
MDAHNEIKRTYLIRCLSERKYQKSKGVNERKGK